MVLAAMHVFESIDSLMFGSTAANEMKHYHRELATISCVFRGHLQAPVRVGCPPLSFKRCFVVCAKLQSIGVALKGYIAMLLLLEQTTIGAILLGMQ
jgi:hypothetical protein